jgi:hypothetical protein
MLKSQYVIIGFKLITSRRIALLLLAIWGGSALAMTADTLGRQNWNRILAANPIDVQSTAGTSLAQYLFVANRYIPQRAHVVVVNQDSYYEHSYTSYWADYWLFPRPVKQTSDLSGAFRNSRADYVIFVGDRTKIEPYTTTRKTLLPRLIENGNEIVIVERAERAPVLPPSS